MFTVGDEVRTNYEGRIGTIENIVYEIDPDTGDETDDVRYYEMEIDGVSGYIVYPKDIDE